MYRCEATEPARAVRIGGILEEQVPKIRQNRYNGQTLTNFKTVVDSRIELARTLKCSTACFKSLKMRAQNSPHNGQFGSSTCTALRTKTEVAVTKTTVPLVDRDAKGGVRPGSTESVADILEHELDATIHDWMREVEKEPELSRVPLNYQERTGHLPKLLHDVIARLRLDKGTRAPISVAAGHHGDLRHKQGYTVANVVDESRILQVCIFTTLHKNRNRVEFSNLLPDVVTIADEVDAQLKQQMLRFMAVDGTKTTESK
jgi:hypothetical protein